MVNLFFFLQVCAPFKTIEEETSAGLINANYHESRKLHLESHKDLGTLEIRKKDKKKAQYKLKGDELQLHESQTGFFSFDIDGAALLLRLQLSGEGKAAAKRTAGFTCSHLLSPRD